MIEIAEGEKLLRKPSQDPLAVMVNRSGAAECPVCGFYSYTHEKDGSRRECCGQCGQRLDWNGVPDWRERLYQRFVRTY